MTTEARTRQSSLRRTVTQDLIAFSPLDVRFVLRYATIIAGWKLLSLDYSALAKIAGRDGLFVLPAGLQWFQAYEAVLLGTDAAILAWQVAAVVLLGFGALRLNRGAIAGAIVPVVILEWAAYRFRGQLYELDTPIAVLAILVIYPTPWQHCLRGGSHVSAAATGVGRALAAYFAVIYFLCGYSKLALSPTWWQSVHLELLLASMWLWQSARLPEPLLTSASLMRDVFVVWPWVGTVAAVVTLTAELAWFAALLSRWGRRLVVPTMLACHAAIFLGSGINFFMFGTMALVVVTPWRCLIHDSSSLAPVAGFRVRGRDQVLLIGAVLLGALPAIASNHYFPFSNYNQFGWSYERTSERTTIYRVGYRPGPDRPAMIIPMNHGGFMDFRWVSGTGSILEVLARTPEGPERERLLRVLRNFLSALRPQHSNARLLGPLTLPPHVVAASSAVDIARTSDFRVLRGESEFRDGDVRIKWHDEGPLSAVDDVTQ